MAKFVGERAKSCRETLQNRRVRPEEFAPLARCNRSERRLAPQNGLHRATQQITAREDRRAHLAGLAVVAVAGQPPRGATVTGADAVPRMRGEPPEFTDRTARGTVFHLATVPTSRRPKMSYPRGPVVAPLPQPIADRPDKRLNLFTPGATPGADRGPLHGRRPAWHRNCSLCCGERSPIYTDTRNLLYGRVTRRPDNE